ncbi:hypothetical protein VT84_09595 [Gemmata sp. SH-PL17]|uniref:hypothetical protein n=1 Tax=Gemmata sp. SH-PL17 TaxID=1630693 RepID=UPI00078D282E|nr:hypothetical protein [Gemmata sp. SH-PL17]AMV24638.1 hypothetical protein VT84_09595 [Gemmata sp. SH-PL17]
MVRTLAVMGRPKKTEPTEPIRLPASMVKRIRRIAAHRGVDPGDYALERFGVLLDEDENQMLEDVKKEQKKPKKP